MSTLSLDKIAVSLLPDIKMTGALQQMQKSLAKLGVSFLLKNQAKPHLTLLAGKVKNQKIFSENVNALTKQLFAIELRPIGLGVFVSETPVIYLRWELSSELCKFRKKLCKETCNQITQLDKFTTNEFWIAKTSIAAQDTKQDLLSDYLKAVHYENLPHSTIFRQIVLIDYSGPCEKIIEIIPLDVKH